MKDPLRPVTEEFIRGRVETNHQEVVKDSRVICSCGWFSDATDFDVSRDEHQAHQDDLVQRLLTAPY